MVRNETKFMESVVTLAEELHFTRAAKKMHISQPMLTKNIQDLEARLGGSLFDRHRKAVALNDAGRAYVEQARMALLYGERAFQAARAAMQDADVVLNVGRSPYTDPFLTTTLLSIQLPLFPKLRIELASQFSCDLAQEVLEGRLDLVIATEPPESPLLTTVKVDESPFYIAMSKSDELARRPEVSLASLAEHRWVMFERRLHPPLYDTVMEVAEKQNAIPAKIQHITEPEEAFPFLVEGGSVAFLVKAGALRIGRNGVTVRPLAEDTLALKTYLAARADNKSKVVSEMVRAFIRKMSSVGKADQQLPLPIYG